jgi:hypothetical protein
MADALRPTPVVPELGALQLRTRHHVATNDRVSDRLARRSLGPHVAAHEVFLVSLLEGGIAPGGVGYATAHDAPPPDPYDGPFAAEPFGEAFQELGPSMRRQRGFVEPFE